MKPKDEKYFITGQRICKFNFEIDVENFILTKLESLKDEIDTAAELPLVAEWGSGAEGQNRNTYL